MKADVAQVWARLRSALYNPSKNRKPGHCIVLQSDLEKLLAEVEQLSNAQFARYLTRITLEELRNGDSAAEGETTRATEKRRRRNHPVHRADRPALTGRSAPVDGVFVFTDEGMEVVQ